MARSVYDRVIRIVGNYTLQVDDEYVGVGLREGAVTISLPSLTSVATNQVYHIADESGQAASFPITFQANGSEEIQGSSSYVVNVGYGTIQIFSNSERWCVLDSSTPRVLTVTEGGTGADNATDAVNNLGLDIKAPVRVAAKENVDVSDLEAMTNVVNGATFANSLVTENPLTPFNRLYVGGAAGDPVVGATLLQASSGATATITALNDNDSFDVDTVTGTFDATNLVTGTNPDLSNFTFTPTETLVDAWPLTGVPAGITAIAGDDGTIIPLGVSGFPVLTTTARYQPSILAANGPVETLSSDGWTDIHVVYTDGSVTVS